MILKTVCRDYFSLYVSLHIYLCSICFPIQSLCSLIMLFCVVLVNCCLYYSEYLIMRKLAHLLFYVLMGMLHVWGGKCIENKAKI